MFITFRNMPKWPSDGKPSVIEKAAEFKQVKPTPETNDNYNSRPSSANVAEHKSDAIETRLNPLTRASPLPDLSHKDEPAQLSPISDQQNPTPKSQRNFLQYRGLDDESQQKAIAANFKTTSEPMLSPKEESRFSSNPKEDLRSLVIQLEGENSKLLSKLAFNEIELKNCKMELDSMTMTIERNRLNNEELQRCKNELLSKEEEMFSLKSKVRSLDVEVSSLSDQLKSKDVDMQRARLKNQEEVDIEKSRTRTFELQFNNLNEMLQSKESEISKLRSELQSSSRNAITSVSSGSSDGEELRRLNEQIRKMQTEMDGLQKDVLKHKNDAVAKEEQLNAEKSRNSNLQTDHKKALEDLQNKVSTNATLLQNKDQEIDHLKNKTKDLEAKLGTHLTTATASAATAEVLLSKQAEVTALETKVKDLEKQQVALTLALDAKGAEITSTLKSKEAEVHNWQIKWKESEHQAAALKAEALVLKAKESEMDKLQERLKDQEKQIANLQSTLSSNGSDATASLQSKDMEMLQLRDRIKTLEAQLTSSSSQAQSTNNDISNLQFMLQSKTQDLEALRQKESVFEQQKVQGEELRLQLNALQATLKSKDVEIEQQKQSLQDLEAVRGKLRSSENDISNLSAQVQSKDFEIQQWQAQVNSLKKMEADRQQQQQLTNVNQSVVPTNDANEEERKRLRQALTMKEEEYLQLHLKTQMQEIEVSKLSELLKMKEVQMNQMAGKDEELQQSATKIRGFELETLKNRDLLQHKDSELQLLRSRLQDAEIEVTKVRALDVQVKSLQDTLLSKEGEISKLRQAESSAMFAAQSSQLQQQQQQSMMEIERVKEELRSAKAENESLRKDVFSLKNDHLLKDQVLEGEKAKLRNMDIENRKLQDLLQSKDAMGSKVSAKEIECEQLRSQLQSVQRETQLLQHNLSQEKEILQQKEKKIKSYQEELLHVQKRLTENPSPLSPMKSGNGKVDPFVIAPTHVLKVGGGTQTDSVSMRDKEVSAKVSTKDICVQCNTPRATSNNTSMMFDVGVQTYDSYPPTIPSHPTATTGVTSSSAAKKSSTEVNMIKQELSQRKQECQALFDLIQDYENKVGNNPAPTTTTFAKNNISSIPKKPKASSKYYSSPSPDFDDVDFHATSSGLDSAEDSRKAHGQLLPRTPATDWKNSSPMSETNKDLLQSLSEIQNTPMPASSALLAVDSSASDMLVYVANLYTKINNAGYALKLHNLSTSRRLVQLVDSNSSDFDLKKTLLSQRLDEESNFVKMLQQSLVESKNFIESGRKQIERMKRQYEDVTKSSKSGAAHGKKSKEVTKDLINNHTNDMNVIIRLVRTLQQCADGRSRLVKDIKRDLMSIVRSKKPHSSRLDTLDKELAKLHDEINDIVKPLLKDGRSREKTSSRTPLETISLLQEVSAPDVRASYPSAHAPPPMAHPAYYQAGFPMYAYPPGLPSQAPPVFPMQAFADPAVVTASNPQMNLPSAVTADVPTRLTVPNSTLLASQSQGLRSQLDHVQRQISYTQNRQKDSLQEYDRHFRYVAISLSFLFLSDN